MQRDRLFSLIDSTSSPVVWIAAQAGAGKTMLATSYLDRLEQLCLWYRIDEGDRDVATFFYYFGMAGLQAAPKHKTPLPLFTPECLPGINVFSLRYFEALFGRLKRPHIIVFDNYQEAGDEALLHDIVSAGISMLPPDIRILILSRKQPPSQFSRLIVENRITVIGPKEMRLTEKESRQIVKMTGRTDLGEAAIAELHRMTDGWAAGIMLLLHGLSREEIVITLMHGPSQDRLFGFFSSEVFRKMSTEQRGFLVATAYLPQFTPSMADELTGRSNAAAILDGLCRDLFFTTRQQDKQTYQYHALLTEFLQSTARRELDTEALSSLQRRSAALLEQNGRIEAAAALYIEAHDHEALARLSLQHAAMLMGTGRFQTLRTWLSALPKELVQKSSWHQYWLGMCLLAPDPVGARQELEQAYTLFSEQNDAAGMTLSWSFIIDSMFFEWNDFTLLDKWIPEYFDQIENVVFSLPPDLQTRAMTAIGMALFIRQPHHPKTAEYVEKSLSLAAGPGDLNVRLHALMSANIYYSWTGDFARCIALMEQVERWTSASQTSYSAQLMSRVLFAGKPFYYVKAIKSADRRISEALEFAAATGIHIMDHVLYFGGIYVSLMSGDMARAEQYIEKMSSVLVPSRKTMYVQYHQMFCAYQFLKRNHSRALVEVDTALKLSEETGYIFAEILILYSKAQVLHAMNDRSAAEYVEKGLNLAIRSKSTIFEFGFRLAQALFAFDAGNEDDGCEFLRVALAIGKKHRYFSLLWWWDPAAMSRLAAKALENGIEQEYVTELIRIRRLMPGHDARNRELWPWPMRIHTLGQFRIEINGEECRFSRKPPEKVLALLKVLIAAGPSRVSENDVTDALWPDAEGDAGHNSFTVTLQRLRKLIGPDVLQLKAGYLQLDRESCFVDAWAFEEARRHLDGRKADGGLQHVLKALELYKAAFLKGEKAAGWAVPYREKLHVLFQKYTRLAGELLEECKQYREAIDLYERALGIDDLMEDFYKRIIILYGRIGLKAEGIASYQRCARVLKTRLGIAPSPATITAYRALLL